MKKLLFLALVAFVTGPFHPAKAVVGDPLDLTQYTLTWVEEFNRPLANVVLPGYGWTGLVYPATPTAPYTLTAHTAWSGDWGYGYFTGQYETGGDKGINGENIVPPSPFSYVPYQQFLRIKLYHDINDMMTKAPWRTGYVGTVDAHGNGFAQSQGYFEAMVRLPDGAGVWPSIGLYDQRPIPMGKPRTVNAAEIDIMEMYGTQPGSSYNWMTKVHQRTHVWAPNGQDIGTPGAGTTITTSTSMADGQWHRFGCSIDPLLTKFYIDGVETFETATQPTFLDPLFFGITLAFGGGWPMLITDDAEMDIKYIHYFQHK